MIFSLGDDEHVALRILAHDEPRSFGRVAQASETEPAALTERVVRESLVATDGGSVGRAHLPRLLRKEARQKAAEWSFADEADPRAVTPVEVREAATARGCAHLRLLHLAQREQRHAQSSLRHGVQEIALILGTIASLVEVGDA